MTPDGRCGLRERHLSTGPYYSFGSWLCLDRGSVNSGTHLKTEVHEDLLVFTDCVVAVAIPQFCRDLIKRENGKTIMRHYKLAACATALLSSLVVSSTALAADPKPYIEIGATLSDPGVSDESLHVSGLARAGVEVTSWAAFEVEGLIGLEDAEFTRSNGELRQAGLDAQFGGFLRLGVPIKEQFLPYFKIGYGTAKTTSKRDRDRDGMVITEEREDSFSGIAFGFGAI